ncbi:MAG TPA: hypothetical protein VKU00_01910 [Chthonomonadaceae bacterium]|nr:hypothetical protein [Chthonomonadaceae bacterium]
MKNTETRALWIEGIGFLAIIVLSWVNELTGFQTLFYPEYRGNWHEAALETVLIVLVAIPTLLLTKRLIDKLQERVRYLEGFLRICAWCRRLESNGEWVPVETYFSQQFSVSSTHGICPDCHAKQSEEED